MADNNINIGISVSGNASVELKKLDKGVDDLNKSIQVTGKSFISSFNVFKGTFGAGLALKAFDGAARAAKAFATTLVSDSIAAAKVQEEAISALNQSLVQTGEFSRQTSQDIQDFASALQSATTVGDETILQGVALAQSFTQNAEQAKELTAAALDFSQAADIGFTEAIRRLGRATKGSTEDIAKFAPQIKNLTKEQLAAGEATRILADRFKGSAAAVAQTFGGAVKQTSNIFGDFQESIGAIITDNPVFIAVIQEAGKILNELQGFVKENAVEIKEGLAEAFIFALDAVSFFLAALQPFERSLKVIVATVSNLTSGFDAMSKAITEAASTETLTERLGVSIQRIRERAQGAFDQISQGNADATAALEATNQATKNLAETQALTAEQLTQQREKEINELLQRNELLTTIDADANAQQIAANQARIDQIVAQESASSLLRLKITADRVKKQKAIEQERVQAIGQFFGDVSSLSRTGNKDLFEIGKAAAIAQAVINTSQAVTKALTLGPIIGPIAAAGIAVKGGVEIATISAQRLQSGLTEVPAGFPNDTFPAALTSGERVVDPNTNQDLKKFLQGSENLLPVLQSIDAKLGSGRPIIVQIGSREIINEINDAIESGRALAI